jgi:hypothetical protein
MNTYKKLTMLISACLLLVGGVAHAKVKSVNSRREFEQSVAKDSMVVALFYNEKDKGLTQMYEDVSKVQKYDDADVIFLRANVARPELKSLLALQHLSTVPVIIFFHKGKRLHDVKGHATAELFGNVSRDTLQASIDDHFGEEIAQYVARKNAKISNRTARENESWKVYYYPRDIFVNSYGPEERDLE